MVVCSVSQLLADTVSHRQSKQVADKHSLWQRTRRQPGTVYIRIPRSRQLPLASITHLARGQARRLTPPAGMSRLMYADTRLSLIQAPQVTAWLSHAHLTLPHQGNLMAQAHPAPAPIGDRMAEPRTPYSAQHAAAPAQRRARAATGPLAAPGPPRSRCAERICASAAGTQPRLQLPGCWRAPPAMQGADCQRSMRSKRARQHITAARAQAAASFEAAASAPALPTHSSPRRVCDRGCHHLAGLTCI